MPLFSKREQTYIGALQCGAGRDAYIEFELSEDRVADPPLYAKNEMKIPLSHGVDPEEIKKAALYGLSLANEKYGTKYGFSKIGYIPNDSIHYDLHARITYLVIQRVIEGGKFENSK